MYNNLTGGANTALSTPAIASQFKQLMQDMPQKKQGMDKMKFEVANEVGVNLKNGYNGDLTSRDAGYVGGYMVKRMIEQTERQLSGR